MAFASPIMTFTVPDAENLNKQLLKEANAMREASAGMNRSNFNGWHSETDLFQRNEKGISTLCKHIIEAFKVTTLRTIPGFPLADHNMTFNGWININGKGGYNSPHTHPGNQWSGCYYANQPDTDHSRAGMIEFLDPRLSPRDMAIFGTPLFAPKIQVRPSAGQLLVFPSYLMHWVYPNESEEERVSIAWNGSLTKVPASNVRRK